MTTAAPPDPRIMELEAVVAQMAREAHTAAHGPIGDWRTCPRSLCKRAQAVFGIGEYEPPPAKDPPEVT